MSERRFRVDLIWVTSLRPEWVEHRKSFKTFEEAKEYRKSHGLPAEGCGSMVMGYFYEGEEVWFNGGIVKWIGNKMEEVAS